MPDSAPLTASGYRAAPGALDGIVYLWPPRMEDERGVFVESYNAAAFAALGVTSAFVQENFSRSVQAGTLRGLHFQTGDAAQAKLVRCIHGAVHSVAVDLRRSSRTYGQAEACILDAKSDGQVFIPTGFAHGVLSLEPHTILLWRVSAAFAPEARSGLAWNDPRVNAPWPLAAGQFPVLSAQDQNQPSLDALEERGLVFP